MIDLMLDPVAFSIGPIIVRWYALAYLFGLLAGYIYARNLIKHQSLWGDGSTPSTLQLDDMLIAATLGVVLGGRLGFVIFYKPFYYIENPIEIFQTWKGGMSFHGGLLGAWFGVSWFAKKRGLSPLIMADLAACVAPIGLFLGRMANFINGELWGRVTDVSWAVVFPHAGHEPRHPSQLYEAGLEGLALLVVMALLVRKFGFHRPGLLTGFFGCGYAVARIVSEFFREPDIYLGFFAGGWLTMGMILSLPMGLAGIWLVRRALATPSI